jgi:hypothetical protein
MSGGTRSEAMRGLILGSALALLAACNTVAGVGRGHLGRGADGAELVLTRVRRGRSEGAVRPLALPRGYLIRDEAKAPRGRVSEQGRGPAEMVMWPPIPSRLIAPRTRRHEMAFNVAADWPGFRGGDPDDAAGRMADARSGDRRDMTETRAAFNAYLGRIEALSPREAERSRVVLDRDHVVARALAACS